MQLFLILFGSFKVERLYSTQYAYALLFILFIDDRYYYYEIDDLHDCLLSSSE